jgi:U3 small nucleolar RNA-associated protein 23
MKVKRYKKVGRYLAFYKNHFGFKAPFLILIDGTFCQMALKFKINLADQMPRYLQDKVKMLTTVCVVTETEKLGPALYGAQKIVKQFDTLSCGHEKNPISAADCLLSLIERDNNRGHYLLATQDSALTSKVRRLPGSPVIYLKHNAINFEKPSDASNRIAEEQLAADVRPKDHEMDTLKSLKRQALGEPEEKPPKKKRKGPKGPNPLSCKKKKVKSPAPGTSGQGQGQGAGGSQSEGSQGRKRKRKGKALHLPNKMVKLLESADNDKT